MDLRKLAKDKPCQVRSHVCNYDPATTVLAHARLIGISGMGMKAPDLLGAWACSACHRLVDGHRGHMSKEQTDLLLLNGVLRTQAQLIRLGIVTW